MIKLNKILSVLSVFAFALAGNAWAGGNAKMLKCEIDAPKQAKLGGSLAMKFKLTNISKQRLMVLKWNTPLEGWFGSPFKVTRDGQWVNYTGAMVKRFRPSESDYVALKPGASAENSVNLAEGYELNKAGVYKFEYNGRLQDVQPLAEGEVLSSKRDLHSLQCDEFVITIKP